MSSSQPRRRRPPGVWTKAALVGKAGEALVAAELLRRGVNVAYQFDGGIDLLAYREPDFKRVVPIQVKARSSNCYTFHQSWFMTPGLVLVQVWHVTKLPEFYIFGDLEEVEEALGPQHSASASWRRDGRVQHNEPGQGRDRANAVPS